VHPVRGHDPAAGGVEHPLLDHVGRAVVALLARLEHEHHVAGELAAVRAQQPRGPDEHRRVQVVPAGVHGAGDLAGVVEPGRLLHRQRIHVAAQQDGGRMGGYSAFCAAVTAPQDSGDGRDRAPRRHLERQAVQRLEHGALRLRQLEADLRAAVQPVPQLGDVVRQLSGVVAQGLPDGHATSMRSVAASGLLLTAVCASRTRGGRAVRNSR